MQTTINAENTLLAFTALVRKHTGGVAAEGVPKARMFFYDLLEKNETSTAA
jgi:hypothetical protein